MLEQQKVVKEFAMSKNSLIRNFYKAIIQRLDVKRFSLNLSDNSVMRGRVHARRTLKGLVADLRLT